MLGPGPLPWPMCLHVVLVLRHPHVAGPLSALLLPPQVTANSTPTIWLLSESSGWWYTWAMARNHTSLNTCFISSISYQALSLFVSMYISFNKLWAIWGQFVDRFPIHLHVHPSTSPPAFIEYLLCGRLCGWYWESSKQCKIMFLSAGERQHLAQHLQLVVGW